MAGLDITLETPIKVTFDSHHEADILIGRGTTVNHRLYAVCNLHSVNTDWSSI